MLWSTLLVIMVCCVSKGITLDSACRSENTCDCCKSNPNGTRDLLDICNNKQATEGPYWRCAYGCKDGYWGNKCWNFCPEYCSICSQNFGDLSIPGGDQICYICAEGYYNGTGITNCSTPCPANCAEYLCDKTTGNCLQGCTNNWSGEKCNVCSDTLYADNCDIRCPDYCKDRMCGSNGECTTGCADDNFTGSKCDHCKAGKHGKNCDIDCPVNCNYDTCNKDDGVCTNGCKEHFDADICDKCKPSYYGLNCDKQCSNCLNGVCDRSTGRCVDCVNGKFGELCDKSCSVGCKNSVCKRSTAICAQGCLTEYSGDKCCLNTNGCEICESTSSCDKCRTGFYGNFCEMCPENCDGVCDKDSGSCESCKERKFYGDTCDTRCPNNCLTGQCAQQRGHCITCRVGFFGNMCENVCPENCLNESCGRENGKCGACKVGYSGQTCNEKCPGYCEGNRCGQENGQCLYCTPGFHGVQCDLPCPSNCLNGECSRQDGACTSCIVGYYGKTCNKTCPDNCLNNVCGQYDGICHNCSVGYYSKSCDLTCSKDCILNTCIQETGTCTYECKVENVPHFGMIVGGGIAGFTIFIILNNVLCFIWIRRKTKETKKDPSIQVNSIYENDKADPDGYEELQIPNH